MPVAADAVTLDAANTSPTNSVMRLALAIIFGMPTVLYPFAAQAAPAVEPDTRHEPAERVRLTLTRCGADGFAVTAGEASLLTP